jgi:hypothetical protein
LPIGIVGPGKSNPQILILTEPLCIEEATMLSSPERGYTEESEYGEQAFSETPFIDPRLHEQEETSREAPSCETFTGNWEFSTPFLPEASTETGESEAAAPEVAAFSEITAELKDTLFREALEQLADEALEVHSEQLAGEYGDRETRDLSAERLLSEHFEPLAVQTEAMLDRFFERLEGYGAESLTDTEIDRISNEVLPAGGSMSPASEQFIPRFLQKAGRLVSGAVKLAGKVANVTLFPILAPLRRLGRYLLNHVIKFALTKLPEQMRPIAQKLSDRLFRATRETHEGENEAQEQTEAEALPAALDAAHLEAEFDVQLAQLLLTPDEAERDYLVSSYGESESYSSPLLALDDTRAQLIKELSRLQPGESAQPLMEQFLPALVWPALKTAIAIIKRPNVVKFIGGVLARLSKPLIGADASRMLGPAIANVGLRIFGFETNPPDPRAMLAESLAATLEETMNTIAELPPHVFENETLLTDAVKEAFENAAASNFPNSAIIAELRESTEPHGTWMRMPEGSKNKRYAKYSEQLPVDISPRLAEKINTFGTATLHDHLRDHHGLEGGRPYKAKVSLYQALPGATGHKIARAEGIPPSHLLPLTQQAAGALLGQNATLGSRATPAPFLATPQKLHVGQRLYYIHPPSGRHHHARSVHSELLINLLRDEIRIWLYLSEPLCQRISSDLGKGNNAAAAYKHLKSLLLRTTEALQMAVSHRHLPHQIMVVSETPNLTGEVPHWLRHAAHRLGAKIREWAQVQLAQYLQNSAENFKRACASHHDGVTLRITMQRVPGLAALRLLSQGKISKELSGQKWPNGSPTFQVIARPGYSINRLRD